MTNLDQVFDLKNLRRAYRWIMSNPDAQYKSFFRDSYDAFALATDTHLKWIRNEGLKERYQPHHASKILLPKPSGIMRPITLLCVEDQVVYQACVNIVADALKKKTVARYDKRVFAHLYAGKSSTFFYKEWKSSYRKFGVRIRSSYAGGHKFIADFDLTSFYDSIDHNVLSHFLERLGIDRDTIQFLIECLRKWTSSTWSLGPTKIYHGHGIPQGPLSSGMLSEVVLMHIDAAGEQGTKTVYLRYVDDIKILSKTEDELRRKLIKLDIASNEIGLFPQTSKINIHKILDPDDEIKSVSRPPEPSLRPSVRQDRLIPRIRELSKRGRLDKKDVTRFKYLLAHAVPTQKLNSHVIRILHAHPELANSICGYIGRYGKIPGKLSKEIGDYVCDGPELYHDVCGGLLRISLGKIVGLEKARIAKFCASRLIRPRKGSIPPQPTYKEALVAWALSAGMFSYSEYETLIISEADWWVQEKMIRELEPSAFGKPIYDSLINTLLRSNTGQVGRAAAGRLLKDRVRLEKPYGNVETTAKQTLRAAGVVKSAGQPACRIPQILSYIIGRPETSYNWKKFFGRKHKHAEIMAIFLKRNFETNIDAFLVQFDSYCDFMMEVIWGRLRPSKGYPPYGHAIKDAIITAALPDTMAALLRLHALRLQSTTAHPRAKGGAITRRLKHKDYRDIRPYLVKAFDEFEGYFVP